jgi:hypothetical protein
MNSSKVILRQRIRIEILSVTERSRSYRQKFRKLKSNGIKNTRKS